MTVRDPWKPCPVPRFEPFTAIRYATDDLAAVVAPPYDVLSGADVDALEARSARNIVRIDVPRAARTGTTLQRRRCAPGWMKDPCR